MLKVSKRVTTESLINTVVKDGRSIYKIFASKNEKGKFDIIVKRNEKMFTLSKNVGTSVKGANKKIMEITNFYNLGNNAKRLAEIVEEQNMIEKRHKRNIRKRDNMLKKMSEKRVKVNTEKKPMSNDLVGIMLSMSAVK